MRRGENRTVRALTGSGTKPPSGPPAGVRGGAPTRWFGDLVLVAFVLTQASDAALTYIGVATFGQWIEANPLVGWCIGAFGVGVALVAMKTLATACAALLHLRAMHGTVLALTLFYLAGAIWPWTLIMLSA
jgi:hypothetical protein